MSTTLKLSNKPEQEASTDVAKVAGTNLAVYDYSADANAGLEDVRPDEYVIPFLYVLDPKSPACAPVQAGGLAGAKAGMLLNTATSELYDVTDGKSVPFIPVHREEEYSEWIPRLPDGSGGGFIGIRATDDPLVLELKKKHGDFGKLPTSDGHELIQTYKLYGLLPVDGVGQPVVIPFKSTGIGVYRQFMTNIMGIQYQGEGGKMVRPPMWAHLWTLGTQYKQAKAQGQSGWYLPRLALTASPPIKARLKTNDPLYMQAKEMYHAIKSGRAKAAEENRTLGADDGKEVPF